MAKKKTAKTKPPCFRLMIRQGNLTKIQKWIEDGKPVRKKTSYNSSTSYSMLAYAVEVGFYSMIELLLKVGTWTEEDMGHALSKAAYEERVDLINLLLDSGAPWRSADLSDVFATMNDQLIRRFLKSGARLDHEDAFFTALEDKHARPSSESTENTATPTRNWKIRRQSH